MNLKRPVKIVVAAATAIVVLGFVLAILPIPLVILATRGAFAVTEDQVKSAIQVFIDSFNVIAVSGLALSMLTSALIAFYFVHAAMNSSASAPLRVLLALTCFAIPFIGMPAYFVIYILPRTPPVWALKPPAVPLIDAIPRAKTTKTSPMFFVAVIVAVALLLIPLVILVIVILALLGPSIGELFTNTFAHPNLASAAYPGGTLLHLLSIPSIQQPEPPNNSLERTQPQREFMYDVAVLRRSARGR